MKKLLYVVLALVLVCTLFAGCGKEKPEETATPSSAAPTSAAPESSDPASAAPSDAPSDAPAEAWDFSDAPKVNLTFAMYLPDFDNTTKDCITYLERIKEATEGTVDFTAYPGGTLCPLPRSLTPSETASRTSHSSRSPTDPATCPRASCSSTRREFRQRQGRVLHGQRLV